MVSGPTPENNDRNYFIFDLPEGKAITEAAFDAEASELLEGSAEPSITIIGPNRIVTNFDAALSALLALTLCFLLRLGTQNKI